MLLLAEQFTADLASDAAFHDSKQALWVFARPAHHDSCGLMQVENVALLANAKDTGFVGVNLYCDDEAGIMGAQANLRASDIANCCGKPLEVGGAGLARSHLQLPVCCILWHHFLAKQLPDVGAWPAHVTSCLRAAC